MNIDFEQESLELKNLLRTVEHAKYVWESAFDAFIHPVLIVDKKYQIKRANLSLAQSVHKNVADLIGKKCYEVFALSNKICSSCPIKKNKHQLSGEMATLDPFSDQREYQVSSFYLKGKREDLNWYLLQYRDIRYEKELRMQLIQSEKMAAIGLLAGGVAHEINNPLASILAFAELAQKQAPEGSQVDEDLREIIKSALRAKQIVQSLLDFSHSNSNSLKENLDLRKLIDSLKTLLYLSAKNADVKLEIKTEKVSDILGNKHQLEQVLVNLVSNAIQAQQHKKGKVLIKLFQKKEEVIVEVEDQGQGIATENLNKIFNPFYTTKSSGEGTGLGLAITYSIIEDHQAKIEVQSQIDVGSVFRVIFNAV